MMAAYCDVQFNWEYDKDPSSITDYVNEDFKESEWTETPTVYTGTKLEVFRNSNHAKENCDLYCEVDIRCKSLYHVGITGVRIVSEARNIEVYDKSEGYLQTVKGEVFENEADDASETKYFISDILRKEPTSCLMLKFLSLKGRLSFHIRNIQIHVTQMDPPDPTSQMNVAKLRNQVQELGDKVSDRALSLLDTIETYQNNQRGTLESVRGLMSEGSLPTQQDTSPQGMMGLLSLFSQMNKTMPTKSESPAVLSEDDHLNDPSYLAGRVLSQMSSGSNGDAVHGEEMYNFLQSVCGEVTKSRHAQKMEGDKIINSDGNTDVSMDPTFAEEVSKQIQTAEQRIMSDVEEKMSKMETRLGKKMDKILKLLLPDDDEDD